MKTRLILLVAALGLGLHSATALQPPSTITDTNHFAYGANIGWVDGRGNLTNGGVIGEYVCYGYIYAANVGWIRLGVGVPTNGIYYQNTSATDYGVNRDELGRLRGYAYGANIGWITFESTGAPKIDLVTGKFSGYAWSANCGWISLSNAVAYVQTGRILPGQDTDGDGIADAWELTYTNTLTAFSATSDSDHDGSSDLQEYLAGTNPLDPNDNLRIIEFHREYAGMTNRVDLAWTSKPTRLYNIELRPAFDPGSPWTALTTGFEDWPGWNNIALENPAPHSFYRIKAVRPLMP